MKRLLKILCAVFFVIIFAGMIVSQEKTGQGLNTSAWLNLTCAKNIDLKVQKSIDIKNDEVRLRVLPYKNFDSLEKEKQDSKNCLNFQEEGAPAEGKNNKIDRKFSISCGDKTYRFSSRELLPENLSQLQLRLISETEQRQEIIEKLKKFGLTKREVVDYIFPEAKELLNKLSMYLDTVPEQNTVEVVKNKCQLQYNFGASGRFFNREDFYEKLYKFIGLKENQIAFNIEMNYYKDAEDIKSEFSQRSCFSTNFSSSSSSRKNNIIIALGKFDGVVLEPGEILSFNKTTGLRNEKNGYMEAKIISNGAFVSGFGGGVCQVSTTLYNACLLAGLEILEVHNHSLPVSYVEPSFDAMVNSGSSDLVVRNNTSGRIIITTSSENDFCKVKIFGQTMKEKVKRRSEKVKVIEADKEIYYAKPESFGVHDMFPGEEKWLTYPKDGFVSNGYLDYYDKNGKILKTVKIRENKYNATRGIILRSDG